MAKIVLYFPGRLDFSEMFALNNVDFVFINVLSDLNNFKEEVFLVTNITSDYIEYLCDYSLPNTVKWIHFMSSGADKLLPYGKEMGHAEITMNKGTQSANMVAYIMSELLQDMGYPIVAGASRRRAPDPDGHGVLIWGRGFVGKKLAGMLEILGINVEFSSRDIAKSIEELEPTNTLTLVICTPLTTTTRSALNLDAMLRLNQICTSFSIINVARAELIPKEIFPQILALDSLDRFVSDVDYTDGYLREIMNFKLKLTPHCSGYAEGGVRRAVDLWLELYRIKMIDGSLPTEYKAVF